MKDDFILLPGYPTRIYVGPDFLISGETTRIDYSINCESGTISPSAHLRLYKAGASIRVYSHVLKLFEEPDLDLHIATDSFSLVLEEGEYRVELAITDGSLASSSHYQSTILIWNYQ